MENIQNPYAQFHCLAAIVVEFSLYLTALCFPIMCHSLDNDNNIITNANNMNFIVHGVPAKTK